MLKCKEMFQIKEKHVGRQKKWEIMAYLETRSGNNGHVAGGLEGMAQGELMPVS